MDSAQHVKGKSCNCFDLLRQLREKIKQIGHGNPGKEECSSTRRMLWDTHPQWSWLLSRNVDYFFPKIKKELGGHHFATDDVLNTVDQFLRSQNGAFYIEGICLLHNRWAKCVNVEK